MNSKQIKKWVKRRKYGRLNYAIFTSVLSGLGFVTLHYFAMVLTNVLKIANYIEPPSLRLYIIMFAIWVVVWIPFNLSSWDKNEKEYIATLNTK